MAYEFQFVVGTRNGETKKKLQSMDKRLKEKIKRMDGVRLRELSGIREFDWTSQAEEIGYPKGTIIKDWRKRYMVSKSTRKYSWNDVMLRINKIQPTYYKMV